MPRPGRRHAELRRFRRGGSGGTALPAPGLRCIALRRRLKFRERLADLEPDVHCEQSRVAPLAPRVGRRSPRPEAAHGSWVPGPPVRGAARYTHTQRDTLRAMPDLTTVLTREVLDPVATPLTGAGCATIRRPSASSSAVADMSLTDSRPRQADCRFRLRSGPARLLPRGGRSSRSHRR